MFMAGLVQPISQYSFVEVCAHCIMWCIWGEQNARSFERCEHSIHGIKSFFFHTLLKWSLALQIFSCSAISDLQDLRNLGS